MFIDRVIIYVVDSGKRIVLGNSDYRVTVISNSENLGLAKSLNVGISKARGRYIARQDADDISLPERLQKQFDYMEKHPKIAVLGTGRLTLSDDGKIRAYRPPMESPTFEDMLKSSRIIGASVMMRKELIDEVGGYDDFFRQADDYDLWLRVMKKHPVASLREGLYVVRRNRSGISRSQPEQMILYRLLARNRAQGAVDEAMFEQVKKNGIDSYYAVLSTKDRAFYHQRAGKRCMNYARNIEALRHYRRLLKLQGASFKVLGNLLRIKFRLLGKTRDSNREMTS